MICFGYIWFHKISYSNSFILFSYFVKVAIRIFKIAYMAQTIFLLDYTILDLSLQEDRSQRINLMTKKEEIEQSQIVEYSPLQLS